MYEKNDNLKICFISLSAYPLLTGKDLAYTGGAEVQQVEIAKELKKRGYEISFITYGADHDNENSFNEIPIFPAYDRNHVKDYGILKKAFFIYKKMKEVDADIYYYHAGSPGVITLCAKLLKKRIVNHIASDAQVTGESLIKKKLLINLLLKIGNLLDLKLSDIVVSQNEFQRSELKNRFNINSILIRNTFTIPLKEDIDRKPIYIIWIGTIYPIKQPSLFLKIPNHFPNYKFLMIGGSVDLEFYEKIKNASKDIPNLEFKGFIPHNKIFDYYKKAILLINTSKTEGFPNIFLEAWSCSIPVISLNINPDGIISKYKLGFHSKTFNKMLDDIKTLLEDKELLETMGKNGRKYVEENHEISKIADQYENLMENLVKKIPKKN